MSELNLDFPDAWMVALRPRRSGRRGWAYQPTESDLAGYRERVAAAAATVEAILTHPASDASLVELIRANSSADGAGARLTVERQALQGQYPVAAALDCVDRLGLAEAVVACVASADVCLVYGHQLDSKVSGWALIRTDLAAKLTGWRYGPSIALLEPLRRTLAVVDEAAWSAIVKHVEPYRQGSWRQRLALSFLFPDRRDWVSADLAELPRTDSWARRQLVIFSGFELRQFNGVYVNTLDELVTVVDALGDQAVTVLLRSLDWWYAEKDARSTILEVISQLPSRQVLEGLLARAAKPDLPTAFETAAERDPEHAVEILRANPDNPIAATLLARQLAKSATGRVELAARTQAWPAASAASVPTLLTAPPWTRSRPRPVSLLAREIGVQVRWAPGEREAWRVDRWPTFEETRYDSALTERPGDARFYIGGSDAEVRPRLAGWQAEKFNFYLENPRVLVAKYELDAYRPVLRLARAKPAVGAELLLPYLSAEVAVLMARWLATSRQYRPIALRWFDRHGAVAVAQLVPLALGKPTADGRLAALALARLDGDLVRAAGVELNAVDAVAGLMARDPLDLYSTKPPALPAWLALEAMPPILLLDRRSRLDQDSLRVLCGLLALSDIDAPHPALPIVTAELDPASLADFAWSLYCLWHINGYPSKQVWAMNALGLIGNDGTAQRLASFVRRWPSDGLAQRAKRGAELLARIESNEALRLLSSIARNAKSTPLRTHAAQALDRVAGDRGLLPEQLDDLLADDLGLDSDGIHYQRQQYRLGLGAKADLVLLAPDGTVLTALPEAAGDADEQAAKQWTKQRRAADKTIKEQVRRLEEAMIVQRVWSTDDFAAGIAGNPLLRQLAQRLVWDAGDQLAAVDPLGDLVDQHGGLLIDVSSIRIAHPATSDLTTWRDWLARRAISQPFQQIHRTVHDGDPSRYWNTVVTAASLYSLIGQGWHWGPTGRAATRSSIHRSFGHDGSAVIHLQPGVSAVTNPSGEPDQNITAISLQTDSHGDLAVFGDLSRATRSELLGNLALLDRRD